MRSLSFTRTTEGTGRVDELTLAELKALDAGSWFGEAFAGEKIPTLGEMLDEYCGKVGHLIEIKDPARYPGIEKKSSASSYRTQHAQTGKT